MKLDRIISLATLGTSLVALVLVLKRPAPVAPPQTPAQVSANAQKFQEKVSQLETPPASPQSTTTPAIEPPPQVRISSAEVSAAITQAAGSLPAAAAQLAPGTDLGAMPNILDQQVSFDGDTVHGQFLTTVAGKNVWVTVSGHLGSKDGFATFDPTEFKVGDLNVPVSLVNDALQKKLADQKDHLKLPDGVGGIKVENGELVLSQH
ncbi:MAG TPA: hypothetical protein VH088_14710 [Terriglobales bacterium]|jgi:hypothetical protein|nr:hypothetical protein [Terriglobales bacterium]